MGSMSAWCLKRWVKICCLSSSDTTTLAFQSIKSKTLPKKLRKVRCFCFVVLLLLFVVCCLLLLLWKKQYHPFRCSHIIPFDVLSDSLLFSSLSLSLSLSLCVLFFSDLPAAFENTKKINIKYRLGLPPSWLPHHPHRLKTRKYFARSSSKSVCQQWRR